MMDLAHPNSNPLPGDGDGDSGEDEEYMSLMEKLRAADWKSYCYQICKIRIPMHRFVAEITYKTWCRNQYDAYENQSLPIVQGRDFKGGIKHYSFDELMQMTCRLRGMLVCYTLFGMLFVGTVQTDSGIQRVLVKVWEYFHPHGRDMQGHYHTARLCDELTMSRIPEIRSHPNVVKLIGFHCERVLAVVYQGGFFKLLHDIITEDTYSWDDRMKVAIDIASVLETFHSKGLVHGGVNSKNIVVDKDCFPLVFDFGLFKYYETLDEYKRFSEKYHPSDYDLGPPWSKSCDIFAYGILLMELISKSHNPKFKVLVFSRKDILEYDHENSFVDDSFGVDKRTALGISKLVLNCLKVNLDEQPSIPDIVKELKNFHSYNRPNKLRKISS